MKEYIVKKHITIKTPADTLWDALTNPEKTRNIFFMQRYFKLESWQCDHVLRAYV